MEAHTFQRIISYVIDIIIVILVSTLLTTFIPKSNAYNKAIEKEKAIFEEYKDGNKTSSEYIDEMYEIRYTIEKETISVSLITLVITFAYFSAFTYYMSGQTIGKKLMHIKVVASNGKDASYIQMILRCIIFNGCLTSLISIVMLFFIKSNQYVYTVGLVGIIQSIIEVSSIIMVIYRKDKKGLHDLVAGTKVIEIK